MADPRRPLFRPPGDYYGGFESPTSGFGVAPPPRGPSLFGVNPSAPSGPVELIAQSIVPMFAEMLRNQYGGAAFQFGGDMNVASAKYAQQYLLQLDRARTTGAEADTEQVKLLVTGLARMLGNNVNDAGVQRSIGVLSKDVSGMLPVLASLFPDSIDRLFPRGSMAVAAQSFVSGGRYVIDPATGQPVSADAGYGPRVLKDLIDKGPEATAGLGAGRLGQLYENLVGEGLIGSGQDLRRKVLDGTMSGDEAQKIQASETQNTLAKYSGAVAAINDIFAENGQSNRTMPELIRGLQKLTQGGLGTVDPATLAMSVRRAQALSQVTGVSINDLSAFGEQVSGVLVAGGMTGRAANRSSEAIARYSYSVAAAARDRGLIFDGVEGQTVEEWRNRTAGLSTSGRTSDFGKLVGALLALDQDVEDKDSPYKKFAEQLRKGDVTGGGRLDLRTASFADINKFVTDAGLGQDALLNQLRVGGQIDQALADPRNQDGANKVIKDKQESDLRRIFENQAGMWLSAKASPTEVFDALKEAASSDKYKTLGEVVGKVGTDFGLTAAERSRLRTDIGTVGGGDARWLFSTFSPGLEADRTDVERRAEDVARLNAATTHIMRRGWLANMGLAAITSDSFMGTVLRGFGMVSNAEFDAAAMEAVKTEEGMRNIMGRVGGGPLDAMLKNGASLDTVRGLEAARALFGASDKPIDPWRAGVGREDKDPVPKGSGVKVPSPAEILEGATGAGIGTPAPKAPDPGRTSTIELKIDIAKIVTDGRGMSISGSGALRSGDAAL